MKLQIHETGGYHHCFGLDDTGTPVATYPACHNQKLQNSAIWKYAKNTAAADTVKQ